eukprot:g503.t1
MKTYGGSKRRRRKKRKANVSNPSDSIDSILIPSSNPSNLSEKEKKVERARRAFKTSFLAASTATEEEMGSSQTKQVARSSLQLIESGAAKEEIDEILYLIQGIENCCSRRVSVAKRSAVELLSKCTKSNNSSLFHTKDLHLIRKLYSVMTTLVKTNNDCLCLCAAALALQLSKQHMSLWVIEIESVEALLELIGKRKKNDGKFDSKFVTKILKVVERGENNDALDVDDDNECDDDDKPLVTRKICQQHTENMVFSSLLGLLKPDSISGNTKSQQPGTSLNLIKILSRLSAIQNLLWNAGAATVIATCLNEQLNHLILTGFCKDSKASFSNSNSNLKTLFQCLQLLEEVTFPRFNKEEEKEKDNFHRKDLSALVAPLLEVIKHCSNALGFGSVALQSKDIDPSSMLPAWEGFLAASRTLVNITHGESAPCHLVAKLGGIELIIGMLVPQMLRAAGDRLYHKRAVHFDSLVVSLCLLTNCVEHCVDNRKMVGSSCPALPPTLLCNIKGMKGRGSKGAYVNRASAAWIITKSTVQYCKNNGLWRDENENVENDDDLNSLDVEGIVVAAHACLLIGCLISDDDDSDGSGDNSNFAAVLSALPPKSKTKEKCGGAFALQHVLLAFVKLQSTVGVLTKNSLNAIQGVLQRLESLESCDIISDEICKGIEVNDDILKNSMVRATTLRRSNSKSSTESSSSSNDENRRDKKENLWKMYVKKREKKKKKKIKDEFLAIDEVSQEEDESNDYDDINLAIDKETLDSKIPLSVRSDTNLAIDKETLGSKNPLSIVSDAIKLAASKINWIGQNSYLDKLREMASCASMKKKKKKEKRGKRKRKCEINENEFLVSVDGNENFDHEKKINFRDGIEIERLEMPKSIKRYGVRKKKQFEISSEDSDDDFIL